MSPHGAHATNIILPRIAEFRARYPRVDLVISSGDRLVDLIKEGIDCVVRAGHPRDSSLVVRRLANMPEIICVSDAECYTSAALAGCGLIQVPRFRLEPYLQAGRLVQQASRPS